MGINSQHVRCGGLMVGTPQMRLGNRSGGAKLASRRSLAHHCRHYSDRSYKLVSFASVAFAVVGAGHRSSEFDSFHESWIFRIMTCHSASDKLARAPNTLLTLAAMLVFTTTRCSVTKTSVKVSRCWRLLPLSLCFVTRLAHLARVRI